MLDIDIVPLRFKSLHDTDNHRCEVLPSQCAVIDLGCFLVCNYLILKSRKMPKMPYPVTIPQRHNSQKAGWDILHDFGAVFAPAQPSDDPPRAVLRTAPSCSILRLCVSA